MISFKANFTVPTGGWIARLFCWSTGHTRGKRISFEGGIATYRCPRCESTWTRKVKA